MTHMATLIKTRRLELGLSQAEVARGVGYTYFQNVSFWEADKRSVPIDKFHALAKVLRIEPDELAETYFRDVKDRMNKGDDHDCSN